MSYHSESEFYYPDEENVLQENKHFAKHKQIKAKKLRGREITLDILDLNPTFRLLNVIFPYSLYLSKMSNALLQQILVNCFNENSTRKLLSKQYRREKINSRHVLGN